ncbi:PREDICTED: E3 ubiquitin-protein ligase At4g11680-like [Tarenaya hassleriana]|uniref:E3 ubiquitin-protein ligase At4g11680-like n=1 Tax=Tarenaya hassleriana TaxID=28532 RepID=UPI00053C2B96|nr:PREDICTED: E3 ubiquitin-protein ligase At4g11680-like [Tarenaya hassleriana]XP_010539335.1 PREDICTED: E3 ubiquitin-protein ligase At4g11680-like [Tarenaya hassleriana]XP_010539336.1 PREDICTED: E3 ubiquitin-protein ligase At4g11680-like [Tarenaya hassleriana]XP_010539339.1 PREDICTED: E3 ubiquitin-protein ligase At4g11680-like [Tarenaya hassleriana]
MNTRYSVQPETSSSISITVSSSSSLSSTPRSDTTTRMEDAANARERSPSSFLIRLAVRVSRARWFIFLRRVFHYQNGSRSDLGSNPFNSSTWMMSELIALLVQITVITFTLAASKKERPIWPVRLWITGYDVGCLLNLMLLYGRYRQLSTSQSQGDLGLGDVEQQRGREETRCWHLMNRCRTSLELFFAIWFVIGNVWVFDSRLGSFQRAPKLHVLCISLLAWNALCYSFPFLLFLLLCCVVPLVSSLLGYNMNMGSSDRGASDDQISSLPSWRYKLIENVSDSDSAHPPAQDPECCICLAKYRDKEEVRQLPCSHTFHLKCVDQWLRIISCCPLCKQHLPL